jgi:hypothetical protein
MIIFSDFPGIAGVSGILSLRLEQAAINTSNPTSKFDFDIGLSKFQDK